MRKKTFKYHQNSDLEIGQIIDTLLLDIYPMMPSSGNYPFTMICIDSNESSGLAIQPVLFCNAQILVMKRTDFSHSDLTDYVIHSKEYRSIRSEDQTNFLRNYMLKYKNDQSLITWCEQTTSMAVGILTQLAKYKEISLTMSKTDLSEIDNRFGLPSRNLQAIQLFDISSSVKPET